MALRLLVFAVSFKGSIKTACLGNVPKTSACFKKKFSEGETLEFATQNDSSTRLAFPLVGDQKDVFSPFRS